MTAGTVLMAFAALNAQAAHRGRSDEPELTLRYINSAIWFGRLGAACFVVGLLLRVLL